MELERERQEFMKLGEVVHLAILDPPGLKKKYGKPLSGASPAEAGDGLPPGLQGPEGGPEPPAGAETAEAEYAAGEVEQNIADFKASWPKLPAPDAQP